MPYPVQNACGGKTKAGKSGKVMLLWSFSWVCPELVPGCCLRRRLHPVSQPDCASSLHPCLSAHGYFFKALAGACFLLLLKGTRMPPNSQRHCSWKQRWASFVRDTKGMPCWQAQGWLLSKPSFSHQAALSSIKRNKKHRLPK